MLVGGLLSVRFTVEFCGVFSYFVKEESAEFEGSVSLYIDI